MNKIITSQEAILSVGKEIVIENGLQGLNMRDLAKRCGVATGSIYYYFPTKSDLIVATIESIWKDIMQGNKVSKDQSNFVDSIQSLFLNILKGLEKYPYFFSSHSMNVEAFDKIKGRDSMNKYFSHIKDGLMTILNTDIYVKSDTFSSSFTKEDFIDFVISNLVTLLMKQANSCDFLLDVIRRIIYK